MSENSLLIRSSVSEGSSQEGVGARLKRLRVAQGFSQRDLSSPGVSYAYISRIEAGARTPSVKALRKLAQKLGVSLEYERVSPHLRPDLYATLGQSYAALGAPDRAVRLFEQCLAEVTEATPEDVPLQIRYATFLSYALSDAGEYERASSIVREALQRAGKTADGYTRVRLYWSLARTAAIEGRSGEALTQIRRAIALLEATDNTLQLARGYLLSAGIESGEGRADETRRELEIAAQLLGPTPEPVDLGMLRIGQSRLAALEGNG